MIDGNGDYGSDSGSLTRTRKPFIHGSDLRLRPLALSLTRRPLSAGRNLPRTAAAATAAAATHCCRGHP